MATRTIAQIVDASVEFVGKNKVLRALPTRQLNRVDPFLFIDHMVRTRVNPGAEIRIPPHPHAGFEVVTYLISGEFFHRDSAGNEQVAKGGDLNWMTSGKGVVHSEGPTDAFLEKGGELELMQVWINLPAAKKGLPASFRHFSGDSLPEINTELARVKVLLGEYGGKASPVSTHTPMFYYDIELQPGKVLTIPVAENHSSALYLISGQLSVLGNLLKATQLLNFEMNGTQVAVTATEPARFIFFGGEPIREKVVSYGPFVMNSFEEIQEKMADYQDGKMGVLEY
ncbi:pirin family protein [Flavihumibacter profundi]|jgi:quercetin 2,3-dioxygenase|uniref:pirin family protein n=1 Tax=Flavihumibacter profundi TaxID=2716883 RepID=UPI001CC48D4E|nr:pirin family protein [Flavihumibacter profundi]MBZ5858525.1 pirin family protein [Flavihumibacter profundi]